MCVSHRRFPHVSTGLTRAEPSLRSATSVEHVPGTRCDVTPPADQLLGPRFDRLQPAETPAETGRP